MLTTNLRDEVPAILTAHLNSFLDAVLAEHERITRRVLQEPPRLMTVVNLTGNGLAAAAARFKFARQLHHAVTHDREPSRIVQRMDEGLATVLAHATRPEQQCWEAAAQQVVLNIWREHWGLASGETQRYPETRFRPYFLAGSKLPAASPRWAGFGEDAWERCEVPARQGQRRH